MERRARYLLVTVSLALLVASLPVLAQNTKTTTQTTTTTTTTTTGPTAIVDATDLPVGANAEAVRVYALQQIADAGLTDRDIFKILPLLIDLRNAETSYGWRESAVEMGLARTYGNHDRDAGVDRLSLAQQRFRDRRDKIWQTITDRIGADKADRLRSLTMFPTSYDVPMTAYWQGIRDIDNTLARWDELAAARVAAANAGNATANAAAPGTTTTTEATVITTTRVPIDQPVYTGPAVPIVLSTDELINLLQDRLSATYYMPGDRMYFDLMNRDVTQPTLDYYRVQRMGLYK